MYPLQIGTISQTILVTLEGMITVWRFLMIPMIHWNNGHAPMILGTRYQVLVTLAVNNDWSPELLLMISSLFCNKKMVWKKGH